jgi:DNA-binding transcriptional LysR family regulator
MTLPFHEISAMWNWLPAYRAVAQTEHLPTASEKLGISASALSRTVNLLEDQIGRPLFERPGRRLVLNDDGRVLLAAVREAMRGVHDGVHHIRSQTLVGDLHISCDWVMTGAFVLPALATLSEAHPDLRPCLSNRPPQEIPRLLLDGTIDVAFTTVPLANEEICTVYLGQTDKGVYCGPGHPLYGRSDLSVAELGQHAFAAPPPDDSGQLKDGWPPSLPQRQIAMHVDYMHVGVDACASGRYLCLFPDVVAESYRGSEPLWCLTRDPFPPTELFAVHRPTLALPGRAEAAVSAVRARVHARTESAPKGDSGACSIPLNEP